MLRRGVDECVQRVRTYRAFARIAAWLAVVAAHPWTRACRNVCYHAFAFLVGDVFEDERVTFSKRRLVANDSYRDRLLAPEIVDLVDLCDALQLSIEQRRAFFRCFLHLDYLRRAGVSRSELLRYCGLRETPAAHFLLPSEGAFAVAASAHRSEEFRTQRWDVLQLLSLAFSLCTIETSTLVDLCGQEIASRAEHGASARGEADGGPNRVRAGNDKMHGRFLGTYATDKDEVVHDHLETEPVDREEVMHDRLPMYNADRDETIHDLSATQTTDRDEVIHDRVATHHPSSDEVVHDHVGADWDEVIHDRVTATQTVDRDEMIRDHLGRQIDACLAFSYGEPSPVEKKLASFLCHLYTNDNHSQSGKVDFVGVHGIKSVADMITLFPVLLFPCVWLQRVVKQRVLGRATWRKLASRRAELQLAGLADGFASLADILAASEAHRRHRYRQTSKQPECTSLPECLQASSLTPRKILPVEEKTRPSIDTQQLGSCIADLQNEDDAWRATADSVLASILVWRQASGDAETSAEVLTTRDAAVLFAQTRREIQSHTLSQLSIAYIQRELIHSYGYQFMAFIMAKSSLLDASGELVCTATVMKDLRRATQRHRKADEGTPLVEDKAVYWKEYSDPVLKRVFYHNIRTGESRWEMPTTLVTKRRKKRMRSLAKGAPSQRTLV